MVTPYQNLLAKAYDAFNRRDINSVLLLMHPQIHWPNGWEGGYVEGHNGVADYWTRQWKEMDPNVTPISFKEREDGRIEVEVHQVDVDIKGWGVDVVGHLGWGVGWWGRTAGRADRGRPGRPR